MRLLRALLLPHLAVLVAVDALVWFVIVLRTVELCASQLRSTGAVQCLPGTGTGPGNGSVVDPHSPLLVLERKVDFEVCVGGS